MKKILFFVLFFVWWAYPKVQVRTIDDVTVKFTNLAHEPATQVVMFSPMQIDLGFLFRSGKHPVSVSITNESDKMYILAPQSFSLPLVSDMYAIANVDTGATGLIVTLGSCWTACICMAYSLIKLDNNNQNHNLWYLWKPSVAIGMLAAWIKMYDLNNLDKIRKQLGRISFTKPLLIKPHSSCTKLVWLDSSRISPLMDYPLAITLFERGVSNSKVVAQFSLGAEA